MDSYYYWPAYNARVAMALAPSYGSIRDKKDQVFYSRRTALLATMKEEEGAVLV